MPPRSLPFLLAALLCLPCVLRAGDPAQSPPFIIPTVIWSGLVFASNDPHPAAVPPRLARYAEKLGNIFGYNQFELIGDNSQRLDERYERWLIPSKDFFLSVKMRNEPGKKYPMKIALFQNRRRLAEFEAHLYSESPLFIRGPLYGHGQLIIILQALDADDLPMAPDHKEIVAAASPASSPSASPVSAVDKARGPSPASASGLAKPGQ